MHARERECVYVRAVIEVMSKEKQMKMVRERERVRVCGYVYVLAVIEAKSKKNRMKMVCGCVWVCKYLCV